MPVISRLLQTDGRDLVMEVDGWKIRPDSEPMTFKIWFAKRPHYCDRGQWLVHNDAPGLDFADGWPRYYFDKDVALSEVRTWLEKRQEFIW